MKRPNVDPIIKNGLKNYLENLKYFFLPLGVLFLSIVIGFSLFLPLMKTQIRDTLALINITDEAITNNLFIELIEKSIASIIENNNFNSLIDEMFISNIIENFLNITNSTEVIDLTKTLILDVVLFFLIIILGIFLGYFITKILIRRNIARRSLLKMVLIALVDSILSATIVSLATYLINLYAPSVLIYTLLTGLLYGLISLFEAYLVHGQGSLDLKKILTIRNVGLLELTNLIIMVITLLVSSLLTLLLNLLAGSIIGFALLEIALIVTNLNAEAFVKEEANKINLLKIASK